jgi:ketosteroid isomerase-like protein
MRKLLIGCAMGALIVAASACGGSGGTPASEKALQRQADIYEISQIEKSFHESMSKKDIEEMMSLWAPNATFTYGPGQTATGTAQIRKTWLGSPSFQPEMHWISDHPAYKLEATVNGDRGTLHFECHFVDVDTEKVAAVTAGNLDVAKIDGRWLITNFVGSTAELKI